MTVVGLIVMAAGSFVLSLIADDTRHHRLHRPHRRHHQRLCAVPDCQQHSSHERYAARPAGVMSGMLNLSRNLGRLTGASVMGTVFAFASVTSNITTARPEAVATGMRTTFAVAAILIVASLAIAVGSRVLSRHAIHSLETLHDPT